jgi:hypothetical protein
MTDQYSPSEVTIQNLLDEHAQALINGTLNRGQLLKKYNIAPDCWVVDLLETAERLHLAMPVVQPSSQFVNHLYRELVGTGNRRLLPRWARYNVRLERLPTLNLPTLPNLSHLPAEVSNWREWPRSMQLAAAGLGGLTLFIIAARAMRDPSAEPVMDEPLLDLQTSGKTA